MRTRRASAIASIAASTSERDTLRAVSSTLTWSAATAVSKSLWSSEKSGAALEVLLGARSAETRRRYSSRAEAWSSGKPSKPSAWLKRTTVELDVVARRRRSSAVAKATSSRWSTMYCATSFCEREKSSKRAWMYVESDSGVVVGVADRFIGVKLFRRACPRFLCRLKRSAPGGGRTGRLSREG